MGWIFGRSAELVPEDEALKGGSHPVLENPKPHAVLGTPITGPWEDGQEVVYIGIGCYWGAEKLFWETPGVLSTSVGFAGGVTPNPTYRESCTGRTNHTEIVEVVYDPEQISFDQLIAKAFEAHDPTQGYRQGNDVGTQYRSAIYTTTPEQARRAQEIADAYAPKLADAGLGPSPRRLSHSRRLRQGSTTEPRMSISSTCLRIRTATAQCIRPAWPAEFKGGTS